MTPIPNEQAGPAEVERDPMEALAAAVIENSNKALRRYIRIEETPGLSSKARAILAEKAGQDWENKAEEITR